MNTHLTTGLNHRVTRRTGFGLATAALVAGLAPAARGESGKSGEDGDEGDHGIESSHYIEWSYLDSEDSGGYGARVIAIHNGASQSAWFLPHGDHLEVSNAKENLGLWVEVRVYDSADSDGAPYGLLDTDTFQCPKRNQDYNLGTPDGSGNIKEGRWVAIRMMDEAYGVWSGWAIGKS